MILKNDNINECEKNNISRGYIKRLIKKADGSFEAKVSSGDEEVYTVKVLMSGNNDISDYECSCPYDYDDVCEHVAAVLTAIEKGEYETDEPEKVSAKPKGQDDLTKLLNDASKEKLIEIILERADADNKYRLKLFSKLGKPQINEELAQIKDDIRTSVRCNTQSGYIDCNDCDSICDDMALALVTAKERMDDGCAVFAFEAALFITHTCAKLASDSDSSSGMLSMTIDDALGFVNRSCCLLSQTDDAAGKKTCYEKLCKEALRKVYDDLGEWNYELLRSAVYFITEKNVQKLNSALDELHIKYERAEYMSYFKTDEKLTRLEIIRKLEGDTAARKFIDENIDIDKFREMAVRDDIENSNYENAEKLCLEKKESQRNTYAGLSVWWYLLYEIYEKSGNAAEQRKTAVKLLLLGDLKYYDEYKRLLSEDGTWDAEYSRFITSLKNDLPYHMYMQILDKENEFRLLLEEVKKHTETVFTYGKKLALKYPDEIYLLYKHEIDDMAAEAKDRGKYQKVCGAIKELYSAGGKNAAMSIINFYMVNYKRRPAMLDELENLKSKLGKSKA